MTSKYLALSLATAIAVLAGCGRSEPPKPAAKKSVAETFASPAQDTTVAATPPIATVPAETKPVSPDQIPNVGTAPAGQVAFGPSTPNSGMDPAGDAERARMIADRDAAIAAQKAPPQPPATTKKSHQ